MEVLLSSVHHHLKRQSAAHAPRENTKWLESSAKWLEVSSKAVTLLCDNVKEMLETSLHYG